MGPPALVPAGSQCHVPVLWGSGSKQPQKVASGGRGRKASHGDKSGTVRILTIPKDPRVKGFVPRSWHWCKLEEPFKEAWIKDKLSREMLAVQVEWAALLLFGGGG